MHIPQQVRKRRISQFHGNVIRTSVKTRTLRRGGAEEKTLRDVVGVLTSPKCRENQKFLNKTEGTNQGHRGSLEMPEACREEGVEVSRHLRTGQATRPDGRKGVRDSGPTRPRATTAGFRRHRHPSSSAPSD